MTEETSDTDGVAVSPIDQYVDGVQRQMGAQLSDIITLRVQNENLRAENQRILEHLARRDVLVAGLQERVGRSEAAGREVAEQLKVARRAARGVVGEQLMGACDGVNRMFLTGSPVRPGSMLLCTPHTIMLETREDDEDAGDYVVRGAVVETRVPPPTGSRLIANYDRARKRERKR